MATNYKGKIVSDGLISYLDPFNVSRGISKLGCGGFTGHNQVIKDLITRNEISIPGNVRISNRDYYTIYAQGWVESDRTPPSRDGITPGFNNISASKLYDYGRSCNFHVFDSDTNLWVDDSYFNASGVHEDVHVYDFNTGTTSGPELPLFLADYANIKEVYPNATYILAGSHGWQYWVQEMVDVLIDLGAPSSTVSSWVGGPRRNFILVGKPGLGDGNAYEFMNENNGDQVAHLNIGLPTNKGGSLLFDGVSDYLQTSFTNINHGTIEFSLKVDAAQDFSTRFDVISGTSGSNNGRFLFYNVGGANDSLRFYWDIGGVLHMATISNAQSTFSGNFVNVSLVFSDGGNLGTMKVYYDGEEVSSITVSNSLIYSNADIHIMSDRGVANFTKGEIGHLRIYDRVLDADEILKNYESQKGRY